MRCTITTEQTFEAAHRLPQVPADHRCARLHGHSYRVEVSVAGPVDPAMGWVVDFAKVDAALTPLIAALDHQLLNDLPELGNPTAELLAIYLWRRLAPQLPGLDEVVVHETRAHRASCRG